MISVQNRRQPLSGNKYIVLFLTAILFVSCGAFKRVGDRDIIQPDSEPKDAVIIQPKETKPKPPKKEEKKEKKVVYTTKFFKGELYRKVPVHDEEFNIVVMLPFHSKGVRTGSNKRRGDLMLEYYQGMKLAFREVEELGSKFNIKVYDTQNDTNVVQSLLRQREIQDCDLIIGPTSEDQIRMVAYFAKKRSIPVFSPITSDATIWSENNYLFNLSPSPKSQAQEFIRYFKQKHKDKKLIILRDGNVSTAYLGKHW
jgi:ABC-type branched-subunit amino acid transport system substrate-binding protein